jgi:hypothetical protein
LIGEWTFHSDASPSFSPSLCAEPNVQTAPSVPQEPSTPPLTTHSSELTFELDGSEDLSNPSIQGVSEEVGIGGPKGSDSAPHVPLILLIQRE